MSLTTVNDKSLWTKLKKVSLTLVNDKKIVIDHGQWQKKLSLTESDLYRDSDIKKVQSNIFRWVDLTTIEKYLNFSLKYFWKLMDNLFFPILRPVQ